jgi:hypothetical protein
MGRKPVLGLVGACLASVAIVGCDNQQTILQPPNKKDVATVTNNTNTGWKSTPQVGQTGASTGGNGGGAGNAVATSGGSFNVSPPGPVGTYPEGRSMPPQTGGSGGVERVGYSGTPGTDMSAGRTTLPPVTPATTGGDPGMGSPPPLVKPLPTGGVVGGVPFNSSPGMSTLPPLTPPGPAHPRVDDLPPPTGRLPVVVPATSGRPTSGAPELSSPAPIPPPVPSAGGAPDFGPAADLPPIPPAVPVSQGTKALQTPPLSSAPTPTGPGVPMPATRNPASFQ